MKRLVIAVVLLVMILPACNKDEQLPQWTGIGTIVKPDADLDDFTILLDGDETLIPSSTISGNNFEDGERVVAAYEIVEELGNDEFKVRLYDLDRILTKDIIQLTEAINDSIGNDPIFVSEDNIWIKNNYLNFIFSYYGAYAVHRINLVKPYEVTHTDEGKLILEFRHNSNNDFSSVSLSGVVSFDLESLKEDGMDDIDFLVKVKLYDDQTLEWEGSYTFNSPPQSKAISTKNKFLSKPLVKIE